MIYSDHKDLWEELLCCLNLPGCTNSSDIFESLNEYFYAQGLDWSKCIGMRTDGIAGTIFHQSESSYENKRNRAPIKAFVHSLHDSPGTFDNYEIFPCTKYSDE
ncbi:hypothetical protein NPIL_126441 [Nephila pilipes]|uniref:Uncharacterized protein n=1 Tax=Nephila pilipes TaxID=299642 RepID=A0A8X6QE09_NEPPI|nr:hypothetical protein NPIL_126441 [Nephila pilipes]